MKQPSTTSPFRQDVLKGKVAVITGGGSGIGFEIARQFGLHGAKIVLMGRREAPLKASIETLSREGIEASAVAGDVRNPEDCKKVIEAAVRRFGKLDILVNNAAGNFLSPAEDLNPKGFKTVLEIDTGGVFNMSHAAFPELKKTGDSSIINISATLHYGATWFQLHASAAKAAIDSMTRTYGLEWSEYGIRTNGIAPGPIAETAGLTKLSGGVSDSSFLNDFIPLRRVGAKFDIAMAAVFLVSSAGAYITGETIVVDGGQWLYRPAPERDSVRQFSRQIEKASREVGIPDPTKSKL